MKTLLLSLFLISNSVFGISLEVKSSHCLNQTMYVSNSHLNLGLLDDWTCLQIALAGINQAYANYDQAIKQCASIHTTGQGFLDCARHARRVRELQVAFVYFGFDSCYDFQL